MDRISNCPEVSFYRSLSNLVAVKSLSPPVSSALLITQPFFERTRSRSGRTFEIQVKRKIPEQRGLLPQLPPSSNEDDQWKTSERLNLGIGILMHLPNRNLSQRFLEHNFKLCDQVLHEPTIRLSRIYVVYLWELSHRSSTSGATFD